MLAFSSHAPLAIVALFVLAGCSADSPAVPSRSASSIPTSASSIPTPTPTASAPPDDSKPELGDLRLSTEGIGYLRMGESIPTRDTTTAMVVWNTRACNESHDEADRGAWLNTYNDEAQDLLVVRTADFTEDAPLAWILIETPLIPTDRGVRVGDSRSAVLAAYPDAVEFSPAFPRDDIHMYVLRGIRGTMVFEFATTGSTGYPLDELLWLRVLDVMDDHVGSIANTGNGGACDV